MRKQLIGAAVAAAALATTAGVAFADANVSSASLPRLTVTVAATKVSLPKSVPAGATNVISNVTTKEGELVLVKLDRGVTIQQVFAAVQKSQGEATALHGLAQIALDRDSSKGRTSTQTVLTPGNWAAVNVAANGEPPYQLFTVTRSGRSTTLPTPAATIAERDFRFTGATTLHVGELVRFVNDGKVMHMTDGAKVKNLTDARLVMKYLKAGGADEKKAEKLATGDVSFFDTNTPGAAQQETITASPGTYVIACFMVSKGKEHTQLGMERIITVTR